MVKNCMGSLVKLAFFFYCDDGEYLVWITREIEAIAFLYSTYLRS
jgi:hypothetical protein